MINSPKEIFRIWVNNGKNKAALPALNMYLLGILAGLFIGFGCHVFVLATAADPGVTCIGEIGLDYYWEKDPEIRALQREFFIRQIELAKKLNKPFLVHSRDAIQDTYDIMKEHHGHGLMHCFAGTKEMAREFVKLGYYIALGGALTFKNARHSVEVCADIDENYLLTETDCPYMAPVPYRGKRNEPSYIPYIVRKIAELRQMPEEALAAVIAENWQRFQRLG